MPRETKGVHTPACVWESMVCTCVRKNCFATRRWQLLLFPTFIAIIIIIIITVPNACMRGENKETSYSIE